MAITAAVVIPNAIGTSDFQAVAAARMVATDLQYAQDTAITTQTPITVTFEPTLERYRLSNASGTLIHPITRQAYVVSFPSLRGFGEVDVVSVSFNGATWVTFDEMGTPGAGGTVVLRAGPHVYTLTVAAVTGMVTVTSS
jgi:hypothetical protein